MTESGSTEGRSASELIDERIAELGDWRGDTLGRMRELIKQADPDVVEEWKWAKRTNPGAKGASLPDPAKLFNSSLDGNARRAIDIHEDEEVDADAFQALIHAAIELNTGGKAGAGRAK